MMNGAKIIAEIGINHNGKYEEAKSLIESSYKSGCSIISSNPGS